VATFDPNVSSPADQGLAMPAEWTSHAATWMAFPPAVYAGSTSLREAREAWSDVAFAVSVSERVFMMVRPQDRDEAFRLLGSAVELVDVALDDAWARDVAPTFVTGPAGELVAVDWVFNGWGAQPWASWANDEHAAAAVAAHLGVARYQSDLVNEGGGIEVNGAGTVVVTKTVQLDPNRNGDRGVASVESELRRALGVERVLWLERGLNGDYQEFGTRGHVDLVAKFVSPSVAVVHDQGNHAHPDFAVSREVRETLEAAGFEVVSLPAPATESLDGRLCDWSYVNCYFANDAVIVGVYGEKSDDVALGTFRTLFPDRRIVAVDARPLFALGGGVHCITQQQPV
jgi:agmatine deiminase